MAPPACCPRDRAIRVVVPKGAYSQLQVVLASRRVIVVLLPDGLTPEEATEACRELDGIRDVVAGFKGS
jgi:hypothetical protein